MENPYGWPTEFMAGWLERLRDAKLNRYPPPDAPLLKARLRDVMAIPHDSSLILGNGSDELIQLIILALAGPGRVVLAPEPSFTMYRLISQFVGMEYVGVPLQAADFTLDGDAMLTAMEQYRPVVVFLAYPNNPTGNRFEPHQVNEIIAAAPGLVVIDEAYFAFAEHSFLHSLPRYDNLLIMRTLSKMGLAGLRLGLLLGAERWLTEFEKLRLPYNINILTQISAEFMLSHHEVLDDQIRRIRRDRADLHAVLTKLPGITVYPSETNFILLRTLPGEGERLATALHKAGILIKNLNRAGELLSDCLRVTVGTSDENRAFVAALKAAL